MNRLRHISAFLCLLCLFGVVKGQGNEEGERKVLHSLEAELQLGRGGGPLGWMVKGNHDLLQKKRWTLRTGASLSSFFQGEGVDDPPAQGSGVSFDTHLRLHGEALWAFPRSEKAFLAFGIYGGGFHAFTRGRYQNTALNIDATYRNSEWYWDLGTRIALGYRLPSDWGFQFSLTNSWRQADFGLGLAVGLLGAQLDGKTSLGLGVTRWF